MTLREGILSAVMTALDGTSGVGDRIYRSRTEAFNLDEHPAIIVEPVSDTPELLATNRIDWTLIFQVIVLVRGQEPDSAADSIVQSVHNLIMTDSALQALVMHVAPMATNWQISDADQSLGIVSMQYRALYQSSENDLSSL